MNPLLTPFPRSVRVRGKVFPVRWDFHTCLKLIQINEDTALAHIERLGLMLDKFYLEEVPEDLEEAIRLMAKFLEGGKEPETPGQEEESTAPRLFSYERDGALIYTAVLSRFGVDLEREEVHWWKFLAMLGDLDPNCAFCVLMRLRRGWINGTLTKEERAAFLEMGPDALPPEPPIDPEEQVAMERFLAELEGREPL